jgi:solute:Na+ symporter, SSS family
MPTLSAHALDAAVVAIYLAMSLGIGLAAHRFFRGKQTPGTPESEEDFYLAGRRVPAWVNGVSYAATAINADVAPTYCGLTAVVGLPIAWYYLSRFSLAWMIVALLFAVGWRGLGIRTGPEFYALRFGGRGATLVRVYTALFAVAVNMVPWIGAGLLGTHKIMQPIFGIESKLTTLACIVPLVAGYVWVSGFAGVLVTDVFQTAVIVLSSAVLLVAVLWQAGGPTALAAAIHTAHPTEGNEILSSVPVPGHEVMGPLVVFLWLIIPTIGRGGSVDVEGQRLFSCRTARDAAQMTIWAQLAMFGMLLVITLPVLGMLAKEPALYHAPAGEREQVYGRMLAEYLPAGVLGLAMAGVLASVMSTISSHLNFGAQTLMNDVLRPLFPRTAALQPTHPACLWIGRLLTLLVLLVGIVIMYVGESLFGIAIVTAGMFASSALFFWAQWWWWRVNFWSWAAAMFGGPLVYFGLGWLLPNFQWWQSTLARSPAAADTLAMIQGFIAIVLTTSMWVMTTLLTRPERPERLAEFYRCARPLGAWGPVRRRVDGDSQPDVAGTWRPVLRGFAVSLLGAAWISAAVVGVSQLAIGRWGLALALLAVAAVGGIAFRRAFNAHLRNLGAD